MGSAKGAAKTAAVRVGVSLSEYNARVSAGTKWCTGHKEWHPIDDYPVDRTRGDGRKAHCLAWSRGKPRISRDPNHERARYEVAYALRTGRLINPNELPCMDCSHLGTERRHEYDHFLGYEPEHHMDVEAVCTLCHADREKARRDG
jgi:hypothetical protein